MSLISSGALIVLFQIDDVCCNGRLWIRVMNFSRTLLMRQLVLSELTLFSLLRLLFLLPRLSRWESSLEFGWTHRANFLFRCGKHRGIPAQTITRCSKLRCQISKVRVFDFELISAFWGCWWAFVFFLSYLVDDLLGQPVCRRVLVQVQYDLFIVTLNSKSFFEERMGSLQLRLKFLDLNFSELWCIW